MSVMLFSARKISDRAAVFKSAIFFHRDLRCCPPLIAVKTTHSKLVEGDKAKVKEMVYEYVKSSGTEGTSLKRLLEEFPKYTRGQLQPILRELRDNSLVYTKGSTSATKWYSTLF